MFYILLWLIVWSLMSWPTLTPWNGPLVALIIAIIADLLINRGLIFR